MVQAAGAVSDGTGSRLSVLGSRTGETASPAVRRRTSSALKSLAPNALHLSDTPGLRLTLYEFLTKALLGYLII